MYRRTGKALTFITRENWRWARELCDVLAQANQVLKTITVCLKTA